MTQNELAEALGISKGQCSKLAARGMPTHSLEAARAWRRSNLDPAWTKPTSNLAATADERNPIDAIVFGVMPQLFFDRLALLGALVDSGVDLDAEQFEAIAAALAAHMHNVLTNAMGFPPRGLNLPPWMREDSSDLYAEPAADEAH